MKEGFVKVIWRRILILRNFLWSGFRLIILKSYWHDNYVVLALLSSAILNIANWIYLILNRIDGDYPVILHYNLFFGVDFLGNYSLAFLIPFAGVLVFVLNALLGHLFYKGEKLAAYILTINIFIMQCFLLLASYLIVEVNS